MKTFTKIVFFSAATYFFSWLAVYFIGVNDLAIQSEDTIPSIFIPVTVVKNQTIYADSYYKMIREKYPHPDDKDYQLNLTPFYFRKVDNHYVSAFPLITGFLVLPIFLLPLVSGMMINWANLTVLAHITSALITALSGAFLYKLLSEFFLDDEKKAKILTVIYLFGSINFALISQALWQHGTLQLFLILTLYAIFRKKHLAAGIFMGLSVLSRPTALIMVPFYFLIFINQFFESEKKLSEIKISKPSARSLSLFILGITLNLALFIFYTQKFYLGLENNGYFDQMGSGWLTPFPKGFLGLWFSPSKGILVYSPIFIFSFYSIYKIVKDKTHKLHGNFLYLALWGIIITHTIVLGAWKHWYGGWSFGYRMASDIIPFLVIALVPFIKSNLFEKYYKLFISLLIFSILVEVFGMIFFDGIWHAAYDLGYQDNSWLWSFKDSEFVFNIRRILVKLGQLDKACPACQ